MKLKSISVFTGILALALAAAPLVAQACGDKSQDSRFNPPNPPEGTETSSIVDDSFSA